MAVHGLAAGARRSAGRRRLTTEDAALLTEIRTGLERQQKQLPTRLFYDERGSELFEQITRLPEYYLTRTEEALLRGYVPDLVTQLQPRSLVELGPGSASKTRIALDAMRADEHDVVYVPVDISADFLARTADALRAEYAQLRVLPVAGDFTQTLDLPPSLPRPLLLTFLGSTIGNFSSDDAVALLRRLRAVLQNGEHFLLGVDLRKDAAVLEAAYDDAQGVTAEFNLNLLRVINRRFGADFDPDTFRHRALYNTREHRIEMHLVSTVTQSVRIPGAGEFTFDASESVRTEISCKYDRPSVAALFAAASLALVDWKQDAGALFAVAVGAPEG